MFKKTDYLFLILKLLQSTNVLKSYLSDKLKKSARFLNDDLHIINEFDTKKYFENLTTNKLGTIVLFTKIAETTMDTFEMLPSSVNNVIVIAEKQTAGKGTRENEWLSPKGCCMFTLFLNISPDFSLSRLSLLQFAAALACVKAVKNSPGLEVNIFDNS